jgi:hypothetical protein
MKFPVIPLAIHDPKSLVQLIDETTLVDGL